MEERLLPTLARQVGSGPAVAGQARAKSDHTDAAFLTQKDEPGQRGCLSANRLFRDLSPEEMKMITGSTRRTTVPKGKMIYMPGKTGEVLCLLCEGSVHLYRLSAEGRKFVVQTIGPMTFFGEMALVGQNMQDLFAEAAEDCTICVMGRTDVEKLILWKPHVALRMLEEIGQRLHEVQERLGDSVLKKVPARVASLLLRLSNEGTQPIKEMSHENLAHLVGSYRETVTFTLDHLRDEGIIDMGRKRISILNLEKLRKVAAEEALRRG